MDMKCSMSQAQIVRVVPPARTLSQQLALHQAALDTTEQSGAASPKYEKETVAAFKTEI